jgi:hypothetical protein
MFKYLILAFLSFFSSAAVATKDISMDIEVRHLTGGKSVLSRLSGKSGTLVIAREAGCPISERYGPRLKELERLYKKKGFEFIYLYVGQIDIAKSSKSDLEKFGFTGPYLVDFDLQVAKKLKLTTTTEVVLFDSKNHLVYRGGIDDQYSLSGSKPEPREKYLELALNATLANKTPSISKTEAPGCLINFPSEEPVGDDNLTFNKHIYPILDRYCNQCHNQSNSINLTDFDTVRGKSKTIQHSLENNLMPPWSMKPHLGPWINDLSMSAIEKEILLRWLKSSMAPGAGKTPTSVNWTNSWTMGEPDKIIRLPKKVKVKASGAMDYQHFIFDSPFKKDVWVQGFEILTLPQVVHHATMHVLKNKNILDPKKFYKNDISRFQWALGNNPSQFPPHVGSIIPAGSKIAITVHYNPSGVVITDDKTRFGFKLLKTPPLFERLKIDVEDIKFKIPPQSPDYTIRLNHTLDHDSYVLSVNSHMHLRGKSAKISAALPNGQKETLLEVDPYRFEFQLLYNYMIPRFLPKGTVISCENHFDNSAANPLNPDSTKEVVWGDQTTDEMSICSLEIYRKIEARKTGESVKKVSALLAPTSTWASTRTISF